MSTITLREVKFNFTQDIVYLLHLAERQLANMYFIGAHNKKNINANKYDIPKKNLREKNKTKNLQ